MWRTLKILLFLWPIPVMAYFFYNYIFDQAQIDKKLIEAHGLLWRNGEKHITVNVTQSSSGELNSYEIILIDNDNNILQKDLFIVDGDMFGGGFVKAIQADKDQNLELIAWGSHERKRSYLLDYSEGEIIKTGFDKLPEEIHELTRQWHQAYVTNGMTLAVFGILSISYYGMVMTIWLIIKSVQRIKKRKEL
ncbi:hypothetical protein [Desulfopila sp. IMCC35008]|uniref:hypothetical protein n=1 Tax=Desulfopila sp. IMCC35008 TaxID=2653858 RepID=UPI0013D41A94|nr:hypothetical protein [Desulfopila sp. IMCC35008]